MISSGSPSSPIRVVNSFTGEYRFLSNFYPSVISIDGRPYPTVEHAYQAAKTGEPHQRNWIRDAKTPGEAKRRGRRVNIRPDWEQVKVAAMLILLRKKFNIPELREKLINTEDAKLVEGNTWGDTFWGVCNGVGDNNLGKLLMKVRGELK